MARQTDVATTQVDEQQSAEVALINDTALLEQFAEMALMIPSDPGEGTENILRQILGASTWDELDSPWETSEIDDILDKPMRLVGAKRMPSTFAGGLGVFLVITMRDIRKGDTYVKTTGSVSVVAQIARAYAMGLNDVIFEWCRATRASKNGFYPQHLKILSATPRNADEEEPQTEGDQ